MRLLRRPGAPSLLSVVRTWLVRSAPVRAVLATAMLAPGTVTPVARGVEPPGTRAAGGAASTALREAPRSRYRWPLDGVPPVVRRFDPPATPYGRGHRGVDLAAAPGAVVRAAGSGVVSFAGIIAGRGVVAVQHADGLRTTYEPVAAGVSAGQTVVAGAPLGSLVAGHPGCPASACLHWGLRRGRLYLDPLSLLGLGRVRLLPLVRSGPPRGDRPDAYSGASAPVKQVPVVRRSAAVASVTSTTGTRGRGSRVARGRESASPAFRFR